MERRGKFDRIQCQDGVVLAVLCIGHTCTMSTTHTNYHWLRACTVNMDVDMQPQFLLTINYMQSNPDYDNIMYTIYKCQLPHAGFTDTIKFVYVTKIKFNKIHYFNK